MTIYILLLRGINVGGHHLIKMADLKQMLEKMGLGRVQTYIQSGNVLFESEDGAQSLRERIEREITTVFGFSVNVVLRTAMQLEQIIARCPYAEVELPEGGSVHVAMLIDKPAQKGIERLQPYGDDIDEFQIVGDEVYFLFRQSMRVSKLAINLHKLGVQTTMRNWNTIIKLAELARAMEN